LIDRRNQRTDLRSRTSRAEGRLDGLACELAAAGLKSKARFPLSWRNYAEQIAKSSRIVSPIGVPPGSRVTRYGTPECSVARPVLNLRRFPASFRSFKRDEWQRGMMSLARGGCIFRFQPISTRTTIRHPERSAANRRIRRIALRFRHGIPRLRSE
jgi:hypothetical protein